METITEVFQTDSKEVNEVYKKNSNYLIEYSKTRAASDKSWCILYFSSHDIYYPNTTKAFHDQLVKKNRYEWYGTRILKGQKHIFLRDIKKQWYLTGINHKINSVEKLAKFLKEESKNYKIITVGSSAGGCAAVLFGQLLGAEYTFSFNGRFEMASILQKSSEVIAPIIFRERNNTKINCYFNLNNHITHPKRIFYFYSTQSIKDHEQHKHAAATNLNCIAFRTAHHGIPFLKSALKHVLNTPTESLQEWTRKSHYPLFFSFRLEGVLPTFHSLYRQSVSAGKKILKRKF